MLPPMCIVRILLHLLLLYCFHLEAALAPEQGCLEPKSHQERSKTCWATASSKIGALRSSSLGQLLSLEVFNAKVPNSRSSTPRCINPRTDRSPSHNETQLMSLTKHPNVLRVCGTWMVGYKLYIAMRLMNAGSVIMRFGWPGGLEEEVIHCILKQALEGINYLHVNGLMHRDVNAVNLLVDDDSTVLLGHLGVTTFFWDAEDTTASPSSTQKRTVNFVHLPRSHTHAHAPNHAHPHKPWVFGKRKSFVGTPCWMAPEVINGKQYNASADM
ncbi:Serine/threonine-protein kinase fray2 [Grifola frondosa]|uniref:Serine/threonine-protein kinase fray2 n=1 Tax=Grifola frondosa TaxID=5627 RepID=A0A1C7MBR9_GRIFR|nr:Serine/threonine-protein kinase fray2 [Grifola frondosa]